MLNEKVSSCVMIGGDQQNILQPFRQTYQVTNVRDIYANVRDIE